MAESSCAMQLIAGDEKFHSECFQNFVKSIDLNVHEFSYSVVAIMGPQSSGKSTLMNHLFGTDFTEMDANEGRDQTTKGVWIAKAVDIEPLTIVMDLEGSDGQERKEQDDNTSFEKRSALFAIAVADIVLINMWSHDIGRNNAACLPLLETVFQAMMRLFTPRRTTLMLVIRDKTKTPFAKLELQLIEVIQKVWEKVRRLSKNKDTTFGEFFKVEVVALSNYEEKEEEFIEQVAELRKKFVHSTSSPRGLAGDRMDVIHASRFASTAKSIWNTIVENKNLDLPKIQVMADTVQCDRIAEDKLKLLASDEDWLRLEEAMCTRAVPDFGIILSSILKKYMSEYDVESEYCEESIKKAKRKHLESNAYQLVCPAFNSMLRHLHLEVLSGFKIQLPYAPGGVKFAKIAALQKFNEGCSGGSPEHATYLNASTMCEVLCVDIEAHVAALHAKKCSETAAKVMADTAQCEQIAEDQLELFTSDEDWLRLEEAMRTRAVPDFGIILSSILKKYMSEYDMESLYVEGSIKEVKRKYLELHVYQLVRPAFNGMLRHLHSKALSNFKSLLANAPGGVQFATISALKMFDDDCSGGSPHHATYFDASTISTMREHLCADIEDHVAETEAKERRSTSMRLARKLGIKVIMGCLGLSLIPGVDFSAEYLVEFVIECMAEG